MYSEIMKTDIIILMITDANLPKFPRGFDQSATYALDNPDEYLGNLRKREEKIKGYIDPIKSSAYWLETIRLKALEKNILLDSMHRMDAIYMVENE